MQYKSTVGTSTTRFLMFCQQLHCDLSVIYYKVGNKKAVIIHLCFEDFDIIFIDSQKMKKVDLFKCVKDDSSRGLMPHDIDDSEAL